MNDNLTDKFGDQAAAFHKVWMESMARMAQAGQAIPGNAPTPEVLREVRQGIFRNLAQSWEEFLRSPQFLDAMKQTMEQAVSARKMTNDFLDKVRNEMHAPSLEDINSVLLAILHTEKRLLGCLGELSERVDKLSERLPAVEQKDSRSGTAGMKTGPRGSFRKTQPRKAAAT